MRPPKNKTFVPLAGIVYIYIYKSYPVKGVPDVLRGSAGVKEKKDKTFLSLNCLATAAYCSTLARNAFLSDWFEERQNDQYGPAPAQPLAPTVAPVKKIVMKPVLTRARGKPKARK